MNESTGLYVGKDPKTNPLQNIPEHGFKVVEQSTERTRILVEAFTAGIIALSPFSIIQILEGAEHLPEVQDSSRSMISKSFFKVYVKLNSAFRNIQLNQAPDGAEFAIDRAELMIMIKLLKARMNHCELERDQRIMYKDDKGNDLRPRFNPDTYIGQKLLLLELLDLVMGTIVD